MTVCGVHIRMRIVLKRFTIQNFIALLFVMLGNVHCFAQSTPCNPLLILIEGSYQPIQFIDLDGKSMVAHAHHIYGQFNERFIPVVVMDNDPFVDLINFNKKAKEAATKILNSGFHPVVIVGHSLGGQTAWNIANLIPVKLVVTLDSVSHPAPERKPNKAQNWWNISVADRSGVVYSFPTKGWRENESADVRFFIPGDIDHSDISAMWSYVHKDHGSVEDAVLHALSECNYPFVFNEIGPDNSYGFDEIKVHELCSLDSIGCQFKGIFQNICEHDSSINIEFFEKNMYGQIINRKNIKLASIQLEAYGVRTKEIIDWDCESPANRVCYNGQNDQGRVWSDCILCSTTQPVDRMLLYELKCPLSKNLREEKRGLANDR